MNYGELRLVDELHRLDQVAAELIRFVLDQYLTESASPRTPAVEDVSEQAGRLMAAGRPGMPKSQTDAGKLDSAREELDLLVGKKDRKPRDVRRVAEILEVLGLDYEAYEVWSLAAEMGDPDAVDYLAILNKERAYSEIRRIEVEALGLQRELGSSVSVRNLADGAVAIRIANGSAVVSATATGSLFSEWEASLLT
ncbi:hypothetical protein ACFW2T_32345 [Streptomyces sp. NPDC058892]|uniref:hypothetical protein n=1 Tax=unclassified Streptomyces TaxID=2593676 RepID=UPI0036C0F996